MSRQTTRLSSAQWQIPAQGGILGLEVMRQGRRHRASVPKTAAPAGTARAWRATEERGARDVAVPQDAADEIGGAGATSPAKEDEAPAGDWHAGVLTFGGFSPATSPRGKSSER